MPNVKVMK